MTALFRPRSHLLAILQAVHAECHVTEEGQVYSLRQVCCGLKHYIKCRRLYDPLQPWLVHCLGDPLTLALGVKSFTLNTVVQVVLQQLERVCDNNGDSQREDVAISRRAARHRTPTAACVRKKRQRSLSSSSCEFHDDNTEADKRSRERGVAMETTNDSCSSDSDCDQDTEVMSSADEVQAVGGDCWADEESDDSDDDPDSVTEVSWLCSRCGMASEQSRDRCWWCHQSRSSQQPQEDNRQLSLQPSPSPPSQLDVFSCTSVVSHSSSGMDTGLGSSQESSSGYANESANNSRTSQCDWQSTTNSKVTPNCLPSSQSTRKRRRRTSLVPLFNKIIVTASTDTSDTGDSACCIICLTEAKDASIVHGRTGHQVTCYTCAKKLRRHGQPCPVCRRPIGRIVRNYVI